MATTGASQQLTHLFGTESVDLETSDRLEIADLTEHREQRVVGPDVGVPIRTHDQHAGGLQLAELAKQLNGRRVRPVEIVDHQQSRPIDTTDGQPGHHRLEQSEPHRLRIGGQRLRKIGDEVTQTGHQPGEVTRMIAERVTQPFGGLMADEPLQRSTERLERLTEPFVAPSRQHDRTVDRCGIGGTPVQHPSGQLLGETCLADSGFACDQDQLESSTGTRVPRLHEFSEHGGSAGEREAGAGQCRRQAVVAHRLLDDRIPPNLAHRDRLVKPLQMHGTDRPKHVAATSSRHRRNDVGTPHRSGAGRRLQPPGFDDRQSKAVVSFQTHVTDRHTDSHPQRLGITPAVVEIDRLLDGDRCREQRRCNSRIWPSRHHRGA